MSDLIAFLAARLDEDEQVARAATQGRWVWEPEGYLSSGNLLATQDTWYRCSYFCRWGTGSITSRGTVGEPGHEHLVSETVLGASGYEDPSISAEDADREHIARHAPARVLRDVAAKRAILNACVSHQDAEYPYDNAMEDAVEWLAAAYSDHPDYDPTWSAT
ncbi:DUF6221 family protein [Kineococcus radiotolerans]|uniref:Uncharacterized protein n=1 Tax=Kineococcus radiotolerans (strain ATCC BAA-149 / DSM 14245 / SRS30216) TaxID=266940 RepID=A6W8N5_KINRD|nr:DUF6221 family protein [Kineococcus radiotolerans]ABS03174.1 hypothetical protein Krad_1688 [Kineococcus radiotolerans SRS30216 = ATCC BAA-149]